MQDLYDAKLIRYYLNWQMQDLYDAKLIRY